MFLGCLGVPPPLRSVFGPYPGSPAAARDDSGTPGAQLFVRERLLTAPRARKRSPEAEVEEAKTRDPIERAKVFLSDNGISEADLGRIAVDAEKEMTAVFETARDAPWPDLSAARSDVQDVGDPL